MADLSTADTTVAPTPAHVPQPVPVPGSQTPSQTASQQQAPITLSDLKRILPPFLDKHIDGFGTFRLYRLQRRQAMEYMLEITSAADENGDADQEQVLNVATKYIAASLGGDFVSAEGQETLAALGNNRLMELLNAFVDLMGAGGKLTQRITEAKNE